AEQSELENQFHKEVFALEKKYAEAFRPLYDRSLRARFAGSRATAELPLSRALVSGAGEPPTEEEVRLGKEAEHSLGLAVEGDEEEAEAPGEEQEDGVAEPNGVPDFWLRVLKTHPRFADLIAEPDEGPLRALSDVRMSYLPDETPGFRLSFHFAENEHFSNEVLVKTYYYQAGAVGGELLYDRADGTEVDWKPGKDLTVRVEVKRQRHKGTGKTREVRKTVPAESFFNFFTPPRLPEDGDDDDEGERSAELEDRLEFDYELGEELKERVIPHAG
ncbi:MAG: nucleosome assembly protein, partial [Olpidium bornovanus]